MTLNIFSRQFGHGPRPVLAIHCSLAHSAAWRGVGAALAQEATITAFDMPCHGKSGEWDPSMGDLHDVVVAEARKFLTEPMDVIGHSFGATVALRLAAEHPDVVRSVVSFESVWFAAARLDQPALIADYMERDRPYQDALAAGDHALAARLFNRGWGDGTPWADIPEQTRTYMADRIHFVGASAPFVVDDLPGLLGSGLLERLQVPVHLMQGEAAETSVDAVNAALLTRLPCASRETLAGAGHLAPITHPIETAAAIRAFWASLEMA